MKEDAMDKATILIVEDEAIVAADLAVKLRQLGYEVVGTTGKGEEAIAMACRLRPQVVLMDIWLKGPMDGVEAAAAIRQRHNAPVIYLTAHSDAATLARAKLTDPFGYILKPFEERDLATHIEMAVYKHQTEQELRKQREWLRVTLTSIGDAVLATDSACRVTFLNPVAAELTGWASEEAVGRPIEQVFRIINEKTRQPAEDIVARVLREGAVVSLANHTALITTDGHEIPIEDSAAPILDDAGHVLGVVLVFHDVTKKRQAQDALRQARDELELQVQKRTAELEKYRHHLEELVQERTGELVAVMQALPVGVALCDARGENVRTNPAFKRIWGDPLLETHGIADYASRKAWWVGTGEPVEPDQWASVRAAKEGETVLGQELQIERFDGSRVFVHNNAAPIRHADGRIVGSAVAIMDVTEAEAAVRRHNAILHGINRIFEAALAASTEDELGRTCLTVAEELTGSRIGFVGEIGPGSLLHVLAVSDPGWDACAMSDPVGQCKPPGDFRFRGVFGRVLQDGKSLFANDPASHPDCVGLPDGCPPVEALLGVPLVRDGQTVGMIAVGNRPGGYGQDELLSLEALAPVVVEAFARQRAEAALAAAKAAAETANAAKTQLLANMSHELRTPMNAILGMIDVALPKATDPAVRDCLQTAKGSADLLLTLLNDLLDSARIESGKLELESAPFSLRRMLDHVTRVLSMRASEKGLCLYCRMPDEIPDAVMSDRMRLQQVLLNLAGNAIKFTERGEVEIGVQGQSQDGNACLEFAVRDTGIGIPTTSLESIFQPFAQADPSMARRFGGTGLGLSICKSLVDLMGGHIWVDSEVGKGTTFSFRVNLPLAKELPSDVEEPGVVPAVACSPLRILLVEDNPANQKLATYILQDRGHRVEIAEDGQEAIDLAGQNSYDVILMDVQMPGMDGLDATAAIRKREDGGSRVPIIAMTAHAMLGDRERCLAAGMDGYLSKPINMHELIGVVERLASVPTSLTPPGPAASPPTASVPEAPLPEHATVVFDPEEAFARCFSNADMLRKMVQGFFDEVESLFPQMREALDKGDLKEVGRLGHRMKGTVVYLAAQPATRAAERVERFAKSSGGTLADAQEAVNVLEHECMTLKAVLTEQKDAWE